MTAVPDSLASLTERERQVFDLLGEGWGISEIAVDLLLRPRTVSRYLGNIREKLNATTSRQVSEMAAARQALESRADSTASLSG